MWWIIAAIAISLLTVVFAPRNRQEDARAAEFGDLDFPRADYGSAIPMIWGTVKQKSPVLMHVLGFEVGPLSANGVTTGYKYYLGMDLAICLGPEAILREIWVDQHQVWGPGAAGTNETLTFNWPNLYGGEGIGGGLVGQMGWWCGNFKNHPTDPQLHDTYLLGQGVWPLPTYAGIAHIVMRGVYYGTNPTPKPYSFVVSRFPKRLHPTYSKMQNGFDCNPIEVAYDLMVSDWGGCGVDPAEIDFANFQEACQRVYNDGLGMSFLLQNEVSAKAVLEECMRIADGLIYQEPTTGKIAVKLIRSETVSGTTLHLDESNIIGEIKGLEKSLWEPTFNQVRVTFDDRSRFYDSQTAMAQDFAAVNSKRRIRSQSVSMPGVKDPDVAGRIANRQLSLVSVPLQKCEISANREAAGLRPGSIFTLSWARYGMDKMVMRVTSVDLGSLEDNRVEIKCIQDRFASALDNLKPVGIFYPQPGEDPSEIPEENSTLFIPPYYSVRGAAPPEFELENARTHGVFGAFVRKVMFNEDDVRNRSKSYRVLTGFTEDGVSEDLVSRPFWYEQQVPGVLAADYPASIAKDSYEDLSGNLLVIEVPAGYEFSTIHMPTAANWNHPAAKLAAGLFEVGGELLYAFGPTRITGTNKWVFNRVWRGLLDSKPLDHYVGDEINYFPHRNHIKINPSVAHGQTLWASFRDEAPLGVWDGHVATVSGTMTDRQIRPLTPQGFKINSSRAPARVSTSDPEMLLLYFEHKGRARDDFLVRLPIDPPIMEERIYGQNVGVINGNPTTIYWHLHFVLEWECSGANEHNGYIHYPVSVANSHTSLFNDGLTLPNIGVSTVKFKLWQAEVYATGIGLDYAYLPKEEWLFSTHYDEVEIEIERT